MATPAPVAPPPTTIRSHGPVWARRRRYISERVIQSSLKHELQRKLDLPRGEGGSNRAERGTGDVGRRRAEIGMVQDVEELRPELQRHAFARRNPEILVDPHIPLPEVWAAEGIPANVTKRCAGRRNRECRFVPVH